MKRIRCKIFVVGILLAVLAGCEPTETGPERGVVKGAVTLDGKPVTSGTIDFVPSSPDEGPAFGTAIENGVYSSGSSGPVVGKYRVEIRARRDSDDMEQNDWKSGYIEAIPPQYNQQSKLEADVHPGENTLDFKLDSR